MTPQRDPLLHPSDVIELESDIEATVRARLYNEQTLRQSKAVIDVREASGVVTLSGNVRTDTHIALATAIARRVAGVREARSELCSDTELENQVSLKLALDPRTRLTTDKISVTCLLGSVMLDGVVDSEARRQAALAAVGETTGVVEVVDALQVAGQPTRKTTVTRVKPAPAAASREAPM